MRTALDADPSRLDKHEKNFVEHIGKYGWFGTHVAAGSDEPEFSYTTGFWLKFQFPELIVFSLRREVAHDTFWYMYHELEAGKHFAVGEPNHDIFRDFAAVLLPVAAPQCKTHLGWSRWFYGGDNFQCLQLIFPDSTGCFPWSQSASHAFRGAQPDLTVGNWSGQTTMTTPWPWDQPPNCAVITLRAIVKNGAPILLVTHDLDDHGWQFLDGRDFKMEDALVVSLSEIVDLDPLIAKLADLPPGWCAWRPSTAEPWVREPIPRDAGR